MADKSEIEWCDATWNPVLGCSKVSQGCKNCYAIRTAHRMAANPSPKIGPAYAGLTSVQGGKSNWTGEVNFLRDRMGIPLKWKRPRKIFVNSQSDLFHDRITDAQIDDVFAVMALARQHTFQLLTKRPQRMLEYLRAPGRKTEIAESMAMEAYDEESLPGRSGKLPQGCRREEREDGETITVPDFAWPLANLHLGVSVEDQATANERIPLLLQSPAAVRWISAEPLLGPIHLGRLVFFCEGYSDPEFQQERMGRRRLDWVVVGGESGPGARPMHPEWARQLRDQCGVACVPFFFKQWGEWAPSDESFDRRFGMCCFTPDSEMLGVGVGRGPGMLDPEWKKQGAAVMSRVGKKASGSLLDGVDWKQYPAAAAAHG